MSKAKNQKENIKTVLEYSNASDAETRLDQVLRLIIEEIKNINP